MTFATVNGSELKLDLYLPEGKPSIGLIIWVHGGAWRAGSRSNVDLKGLVGRGWAVASVDYRLSTVAPFPAQIHDIKAAIRYLRAHAAERGYPSQPFVIAGSSAGGHLAALVGVTNDLPALEGAVGADTAQSSRVQAIVDLYGASNLTTILAQRARAFEHADLLRWIGPNAEFLAEMRYKAGLKGIPFDAYRAQVKTPAPAWDIAPNAELRSMRQSPA